MNKIRFFGEKGTNFLSNIQTVFSTISAKKPSEEFGKNWVHHDSRESSPSSITNPSNFPHIVCSLRSRKLDSPFHCSCFAVPNLRPAVLVRVLTSWSNQSPRHDGSFSNSSPESLQGRGSLSTLPGRLLGHFVLATAIIIGGIRLYYSPYRGNALWGNKRRIVASASLFPYLACFNHHDPCSYTMQVLLEHIHFLATLPDQHLTLLEGVFPAANHGLKTQPIYMYPSSVPEVWDVML